MNYILSWIRKTICFILLMVSKASADTIFISADTMVTDGINR